MASTTTQSTYPSLCIPRAMLFHTVDFVENAFNQAMGGKFVKTVNQSTTTDRSGTQFNVFFIHPDQDFKSTRSTETLYRKLSEEGTVNISTGVGQYFWKVKLYVPYLKAPYMPKAEVPVPVGPRIMTESDLVEFRKWQAEKANTKGAVAAPGPVYQLVPIDAQYLIEQQRKAAQEAQRAAYGGRIYNLVSVVLSLKFPEFLAQFPENPSGKITGMMLEMESSELDEMIKNPEHLLERVSEAIDVLREHFKMA